MSDEALRSELMTLLVAGQETSGILLVCLPLLELRVRYFHVKSSKGLMSQPPGVPPFDSLVRINAVLVI